MSKLISVYNIRSTEKAVMGDYYQVHTFNAPPMVVIPSGEPAQFLEKVEVLTSRIERVSFIDDHQNRIDEYFTIDPRVQEKILLLVEQCEIDRYKRTKKQLEEMYGNEQSKNKKIINTGIATRIKWLFTGVKL